MTVPTFVVNLKNRTDRRLHIEKEFSEKTEFNLSIVEPLLHPIPAVSLWLTIKDILKNIVWANVPYILLCEDDHQFTENYSPEILFKAIDHAEKLGADVLSGGVSWFEDVVPVSGSLFWMHRFSGMQFTIIFRRFFQTITNAVFTDKDVADGKISQLSSKKFLVFPFFSVQKEFGYSDVTKKNDGTNRVEMLFHRSKIRSGVQQAVKAFYSRKKISGTKSFDLESISIPTYIVIHPDDAQQSSHIKKQFEGKEEFDLMIVDGYRNEENNIDLWKSIRKVIKIAIKNKDDVIVICTANHEFTRLYSKEHLLISILEAHQLGTEILLGGMDNFGMAVPILSNRLWIDWFSDTEFMVLYKPVFEKILNLSFVEERNVDKMLSSVTFSKIVTFPLISVRRPDSRGSKNDGKFRQNSFTSVFNRLNIVNSIYGRYSKDKSGSNV